MKVYTAALIGVLAAGTGATSLGLAGEMTHSTKPKSTVNVAAVLAQAETLLNKQMPYMIDKEVRVDRAVAGPGRRMTYHYTLVALNSTQINSASLAAVMGPLLRNKVCKTPEAAILFEHGVTSSFAYSDSDGKEIGIVDVTPQDCGR